MKGVATFTTDECTPLPGDKRNSQTVNKAELEPFVSFSPLFFSFFLLMLRVHSILYLQHVWTRPSSNVEEVEPEPQIEEEQPVQTEEPEITVEATPEPEEPAVDNTEHEESEQEHVVSEEEQQQQPVLVEGKYRADSKQQEKYLANKRHRA